MKTFLIILLILIVANVESATNAYTITNRTYTVSSGDATTFRTLADDVYTQIESQVNSALPNIDTASFMKGTANSNIVAMKGLGVDYTDSMDFLSVGFDFSGAVALGSASIFSGSEAFDSVKGMSLITSLNAGINLNYVDEKDWIKIPSWGIFDLKKLKLYMNFFSVKQSQKLSSYTVGIDTTNFSLRGSYKIKEGKNFQKGIYSWGGIDLVTGLEYSKFKLTSVVPMNQTATSETGFTTASGNFVGNVTVGVDVNTVSIPIELSVSADLFYVLGMYFGFGTDLSFGTSTAVSDVDSVVSQTISGGGISGNSSGDGTVDLGGSDNASLSSVRWFTGMQLNLWIFKPYIQLQNSITSGVWGASTGMKLTW